MRSVTKIKKLIMFVFTVVLSSHIMLAQNIVVDGNFHDDSLSSAWSSYVADFAGVSATVGVTNNEATVTEIAGTAGTGWHIQFNQVLTADQIAQLEVGSTYVISFDAKSSEADRPLGVFLGADDGSSTTFRKDTTLTTTMENYSLEFQIGGTVPVMKLSFEMGLSNADVTLDNVVLEKKVNDIVIAGGFSGDTLSSAWSSYVADFAGVTATVGVTNNEATVTEIAGTAGTGWHIQFNQVLTMDQVAQLEVGSTYVISFDAKSSEADRPIGVFLGADDGSSTTFRKDTTLSTTMENYSLEFQVGGTVSVMKLSFEMGLSNADVTLDNVRLYTTSSGEEAPSLPEFGDNKILFVDGPDLTIPQVTGTTVTDIIETENKVELHTGGAFFQSGYIWEKNGLGGLDFTQNMADVDTVYLRVRMNPADHTAEDTGLRSTGGVFLADNSNGTNSNLQWGILWKFPAADYDNEWHDYAIPLPKPTIAEHDSAKKGLDLNGNPLPAEEQYGDLQMGWEFPAAYNGVYDVTPNDSANGGDPEWDKLARVVISVNNDRSGSFYVDDFYIGSKEATDLSIATTLPDAPGTVAAAATAGTMDISWSHNPSSNIFAYDLYYSGEEITDVTASGVNYVGQYLANDALGFKHKVESPHPGDVAHTYYYSVVPKTSYGITDESVFSSTSTVASGDVKPYIFELTAEQENAILADLDGGAITGEYGIPDSFKPFELRGEADSADASAKVWMAFGRGDNLNTMYIYLEAYDDDILGGPANEPSAQTGTTIYPRQADATTWIPTIFDNDPTLEWNYYLKDQIKFNFGTYGVNYVSGTPNEARSRGANPDYFLSLQPRIGTDVATGPDGMLTRFWVTEPNTSDADIDYNTTYYNSNHLFTYASLYENIMDGETRVGWKALVAFDTNDLLVAVDGSSNPVDSPFEFPGKSEIKYIPLTIELTDKDSGDPGNWWETFTHVYSAPSGIGGASLNEWTDDLTGIGTVAMAGADVATSIDDQISEVPLKFELNQNYPNPFNPSTSIKFSLPKTSDVTINIYNVLGQRVATLLNNESYKAGSYTVNFDASNLSSGLYIYRLEAGSFSSAKKMMLIK